MTDVEHGESSFASATGCYNSDDESTSSDDDNEDDSDDYLSNLYRNSSTNSGTWAFKNGYNLTTFDQLECHGKWSNDLPLPLPMWAKKSKPAYVINTVIRNSFKI